MTDGVNGWLVAALADERIVRGHASVFAKAQYLSRIVVGILRPHEADLRACSGPSDSHVQHAVLSKCDSRSLCIHVVGHEDIAHIGHRFAVPRTSQDGIASQVARNW